MRKSKSKKVRVISDVDIESYTSPPTSEGCHTIDRVVLPRIEDGMDYGAERVLLACLGRPDKATDRREVWWTKACQVWLDRVTGYVPEPGELVLVSPSVLTCTVRTHIKRLKQGGRLSRKVILEFAADIDDHFGRTGVGELVAKVYTKHTVVVDPVEGAGGSK